MKKTTAISIPTGRHKVLVTLATAKGFRRPTDEDMDAVAAAWLTRRLKTARPKTQKKK